MFTYFCMNTAYGIANILSRGDNNRESQKDDTCNAPVEAEYYRGAVGVNQSIKISSCRNTVVLLPGVNRKATVVPGVNRKDNSGARCK